MMSSNDDTLTEDESESQEEEGNLDDDPKVNESKKKESKKKDSPPNQEIFFPCYSSIEEDKDHFSAATQTPMEFQKQSKIHFSIDHFLHNCSGGALVDKYHEAVLDYIENVNINELSVLRGEMCERIQKLIKFQRCTFGNVSKCFDEQPQNLYSSLNVSLYLVIDNDHFSFYSAQKGYEVTGSIDDEVGISILSYISRGLLKPGLLQKLKNKNLYWYDGCLICEIIDYRRSVPRSVRTQLKVSQYDIQSYGIECEQQFILAQNPLICLDPSPAVANVARAAMNNRLRWEPSDTTEESKLQFVARRRPDLFIQEDSHQKKELSAQSSSSSLSNDGKFTNSQRKNYRQRMIDTMLGVSQDSREEKK